MNPAREYRGTPEHWLILWWILTGETLNQEKDVLLLHDEDVSAVTLSAGGRLHPALASDGDQLDEEVSDGVVDWDLEFIEDLDIMVDHSGVVLVFPIMVSFSVSV